MKHSASQFLGVSPKPPARIFFDPRRSRRWGRLRPRARAPSPFVASRHFPRPAGESSPNPCRPFLFLLEEKEAKDYLGGHPLNTPEGERSGRVPLAPTAGILGGRSKHDKRAETRFQRRKILLFVNLCRYRATSQQPISLVSGANASESSQCNLPLFRANLAGRCPRYGLTAKRSP